MRSNVSHFTIGEEARPAPRNNRLCGGAPDRRREELKSRGTYRRIAP
jgi:hypothetical protein